MTPDPLEVRAGEGDVLRLFRVADGPEGAALRERGEAALPGALPDPDLRPDRAVIVRTRDLGGMSLAGYLSEGFDAPDDELMRAGDALRGVDGTVVALPASALGPRPRRLEPTAALEPLAALRLSGAPGAAPPLPPSHDPVAEPARPPLATPEGRRLSGPLRAAIVAAALLVAALLVAVLAFG